jgi:hypothetical protein
MTEVAHDPHWGFLCNEYLHEPANVTKILKEVEEACEASKSCGRIFDDEEFKENRCAAFPSQFTGQLQDHHHELRSAFVERLCMCQENNGFWKLNKMGSPKLPYSPSHVNGLTHEVVIGADIWLKRNVGLRPSPKRLDMDAGGMGFPRM